MPKDRIITAALEIVDRDGPDALTLRSLAEHLGSSTATLYRHVANRSALLDLVVERVFDEVEVDPDELVGEDWATALAGLGTTLFTAVARHPNVSPLVAGRVPTGPNAMRLREACLTLLLDHGFPAAEARVLTATFGRFVIGFASQVRSPGGFGDEDAEAAARLRRADPDLYPATRRSAADQTIGLDEEFRVAVDLLTRGLRDLAEHTHGRAEP